MLKNVDLLGLDNMGENPGMNPIWGALIGGGAAGITSMTLGHAASGPLQANRNLIGLGAGLAVSGAMYAMKSTRHAALGGFVGAFLASGLAWLEQTLFGTVQLPTATAQTAIAVAAQAPQVAAATANSANPGMGIAQINALNGLGIAQLKALSGGKGGRGMGLATISNQPKAVGTIPGVAGLRASAPGTMPANLLGQPSQAQQQVRLMGGPRIHNISSHYGATSTGGGRR